MSWLDVLGWGGSALLVFSVMQARVLRFRALNLLACIVLTVFNAMIAVWPMVGMNVALAGINTFFLARLLRQRHDVNAFDVIRVSPTDDYVQHVLGVHDRDIRRHQPDLDVDLSAPEVRCFLVLHGDETVGVVLLREQGDGTAQVLLDYVTPRFRDFTPGEFLWRRSRVLAGSGIRRVRTPPGMVGPYYDRIGFRREGDAYVLEL